MVIEAPADLSKPFSFSLFSFSSNPFLPLSSVSPKLPYSSNYARCPFCRNRPTILSPLQLVQPLAVNQPLFEFVSFSILIFFLPMISLLVFFYPHCNHFISSFEIAFTQNLNLKMYNLKDYRMYHNRIC